MIMRIFIIGMYIIEDGKRVILRKLNLGFYEFFIYVFFFGRNLRIYIKIFYIYFLL